MSDHTHPARYTPHGVAMAGLLEHHLATDAGLSLEVTTRAGATRRGILARAADGLYRLEGGSVRYAGMGRTEATIYTTWLSPDDIETVMVTREETRTK